jgi:hypothetical protein
VRRAGCYQPELPITPFLARACSFCRLPKPSLWTKFGVPDRPTIRRESWISVSQMATKSSGGGIDLSFERVVKINPSKSAGLNFRRKRSIIKQFGRLIST